MSKYLNESFLYITGYDDLEELKSFIKQSVKQSKFIYVNKKIDAPSFDEVELIMSFVKTKDIVTIQLDELKRLLATFYPDFSASTQSKLTTALVDIIKRLVSNNQLNNTIIKNAFVKILKAIDSTFLDVFKSLDNNDKKVLIYYGEVSKYDLLSFDVMNSLGIKVIILSEKKVDAIIKCSYKQMDGSLHSFDALESTLLGRDLNSPIVCNSWITVDKKDTIENYLTNIFKNSIVRVESGRYRTLNIGFSGVLNESSYELALYNFGLSKKDKMVIVNNGFINPTYDELQEYDNFYSNYTDIKNILEEFICFKDTAIPTNISIKLEELMKKLSDNPGRKKSVSKVYTVWVLRLCKALFKSKLSIDDIPILVLFGEINDRTEEILDVISELPLDIVHFATNKQWEIKSDKMIYIDVGASSVFLKKFPTEMHKISTVETVAYNAEQELTQIMYSDNIMFRFKQFKDINPVQLKTTYEEVNILWGEPAKFRPSFNSAGDVATVPTIFMKVNGVKSDVNEYLNSIKSLNTEDTIFVTSFPYMSSVDGSSPLYQFVKQVIYNKTVDFDRVKKSNFWNYGIYSIETQNLICNRVQNMMNMEWTNGYDNKFVYRLLAVLLNIPHDIIKLIHKYDFTSNIPKLVYFNCGETPCSIEDCILIMFLKSCAFDIMVYAPTGYLVIEKFIDKKYFTSVELGDYKFDLTANDLNRITSNGKKRGLFSTLFGN